MKIKNSSRIYFIIFISLTLSLSLSYYFISLYDGYNLNGVTHIMLKEETLSHWYQGAKIIEQIKSGIPFYIAGDELFTKPLPQRIVVLYSYLTNFEIINDWNSIKINLGGKLPFLFTQSIIYFIVLYFFYKQISKKISSNIVFFIIAFLSLEPTLFQYHSSFWTESFYFSLQLLILTLMLDDKEKKINFAIIGLLLGILFIQRTAGFFYFIVVFIYYFFTIKNQKYLKVSILISFYLIIFLSVGLHNFKRMGLFYVMPLETKYCVYSYFSKGILQKVNNFTPVEIDQQEVKKSLLWLEKNGVNIDYLKGQKIDAPYGIGLRLNNEKDKIKFYSYLNKRAYKILLENPLATFKELVKGTIHFSVLNPFFIYYDYEYYKDYSSGVIGDFVYSDKHKELIPYRIIYSLIIYSFVFFGIISCYRKDPKLCLLLIGSILYYYLISGWYGKTRLFVPILIYLSIFFGYGIDFLKTYSKKNLIK